MRKNLGKYKIAAYIRVSTEEQAENPEGSIKNQEQRIQEYVKTKNGDGPFGEIVEVFCDPGISAKDMNRPALQRMLSAIRRGDVNLVVVTEISRLSRAMRDFTLLWDFLKEHDCQFQSLRDNFDTTTPAGEMILFTLANFAQFERKQLGERISNAFQARAKRGLWNGGILPLGYELDPEKPGHLRIVSNEAEIVGDVYETFLREETLTRAGKALNDKGARLPKRPRGGGGFRHSHFTVDALYRILTNRAYIGRRVFKTKDGIKEANATWQPIIDEARFTRVQEMLKNNKSRKKPPATNRYPYLLSGLALCKTCGDRMVGKSAHGNGGKIGYYEHGWATKVQSCLSKKVFACEPHRILAKKIEPVVWEDVKRLLTDKHYMQVIFEEARANSQKFSKRGEVERLQNKVASLQNQIEATTERVSELPKGINAQIFFDQIMKLQKAKEDYEVKLSAIKAEGVNFDSPINVAEFEKFTSELKLLAAKTIDPNVQASICRKIIKKVEVSTKGIAIHYHVGDHHYEKEFCQANESNVGDAGETESRASGLVGEKPARPILSSRPLPKYRRSGFTASRSDRFFVGGSNSLTSGRASRTRTWDPPVMSRLL